MELADFTNFSELLKKDQNHGKVRTSQKRRKKKKKDLVESPRKGRGKKRFI